MTKSLAFFVSHHGFGHAARACAAIEALYSISPELEIHIFSIAPEWFFRQSLNGKFTYHPYRVDVGLIQKTSFEEDIPATITQLQSDLPYNSFSIKPIVHELNKLNCAGIVCDIAPIGILIAQQLGIPSFLIENFTWDWILSGYVNEYPELKEFIDYYHTLFPQAAYHVQSDPVCLKGRADINIAPISRKPKNSPNEVRNRLKIPHKNRIVVFSVAENNGLIRNDFDTPLSRNISIIWITPAIPSNLPVNVIPLSPRSDFYHPDLIQAADALIAKAGYSTLAEAYQFGVPYGFILRDKFPESTVLHQYLLTHRLGKQITKQDLSTPVWLKHLEELLAMPKRPRQVNDAEVLAQFILARI